MGRFFSSLGGRLLEGSLIKGRALITGNTVFRTVKYRIVQQTKKNKNVPYREGGGGGGKDI